MKNIRVYNAEKYKGDNYTKVKENIYKTTVVSTQAEKSFSVQQVTDEELLEELVLR